MTFHVRGGSFGKSGKGVKRAHESDSSAQNNKKSNLKCYGCGELGHIASECPKRKAGDAAK